jgi:hypothetical protein
MFNITEILNKIDNAAKESFEDNSTEELSATSIRRQRKGFNEDVAEEDENKSYRKVIFRNISQMLTRRQVLTCSIF